MTTDPSKQDHIHHPDRRYSPDFYEIKVLGQLDSLWEQWFEGMAFSHMENGESGVACTLISGPVTDQSTLHGLLIKIRDLNLKLISVRRINSEPNQKTLISVNTDGPSTQDSDKEK